MDVELPDGTVIEDVPEGTTKTDLMSRIMKARAQGMEVGPKNEQDAARWAPPSLPMRALKDTAHGVTEAYGALREAVAPKPIDVPGGGSMIPSGPFGPLGALGPLSPLAPFMSPESGRAIAKQAIPSTSEVNNLLTKLGLDITVPPATTPAEKFLDPAFRMGGSMIFGPAAKTGSMAGPVEKFIAPAVKRNVVGDVAGGFGEATRTLTGENQDKWYGTKHPDVAGLAAELAALIPAQMAAARTANTTKVLNPVLRDTSEKDIRAADLNRRETSDFLGVPVMLQQGFTKNGPIQGLSEQMVRSEGGMRGQKTLADQLVAAMTKGKEFAEGPTTLPTGFAEENRVMQAGKAAIGEPAKIRSETTRPLYDLAKKEPFDTNEIKSIIADLEAGRISETMLKSSTAGKALLGHIKKLQGAIAEGTGTPATYQIIHELNGSYPQLLSPGEPGRVISSSDIGRLAKEAKTKQDSLYKAGKDTSAAKAHQMAGEIIDERLKDYPAWRTAQERYTALSDAVQKMKVSPMQEAFPREARTTGRGNWTVGEQFLLDQRHEADSVREVARFLKAQDPEAFPLMVKKTWTDVLETASKKVGGINPDLAPGTFSNVIAGPKGSKQREKFHAVVEEAGMDKATADRLMDAFDTISTGREGVGGINPEWLGHAAGANPASSIARTPMLAVGGSPAAAAMERVVSTKTMSRLVDLMTDPKWVKEVIRISQYSPTDRAFKTGVTGLLGLIGSRGGGPEQPTPEEHAAEIFKMPKGAQ